MASKIHIARSRGATNLHIVGGYRGRKLTYTHGFTAQTCQFDYCYCCGALEGTTEGTYRTYDFFLVDNNGNKVR